MEATSFGIPVLATDVGGTKEIVNSETGILMPASPDPHSVANNLRLILETKARNPEARLKTYNFWNSHFNAKTNYIAFCKSLKETNRRLGR
jgi:glycosyltransferase involved in cell wall biosynthesis